MGYQALCHSGTKSAGGIAVALDGTVINDEVDAHLPQAKGSAG